MSWMRDLMVKLLPVRDGTERADSMRREAERELRRAQRQTGQFESLAGALSDVPDDEWARRVAQAFRRR
jgi:hypothetical protein